eukprot:12881559-Prorocentrum_lima.AAC.1
MTLPPDAPTCGTRVLIANPPKEIHAFESKMEEGIFLYWDPKTIQGAYSCETKGKHEHCCASAPNPWPHEDVKE